MKFGVLATGLVGIGLLSATGASAAIDAKVTRATGGYSRMAGPSPFAEVCGQVTDSDGKPGPFLVTVTKTRIPSTFNSNADVASPVTDYNTIADAAGKFCVLVATGVNQGWAGTPTATFTAVAVSF